MNKKSKAGLTDAVRPPKTKTCNTCKKEKPLKDFPKNGQNKDGRQYKCRECYKELENQKKASQNEYSKKFFTF